MIYFDNAATSWPKPEEVTAALVDAMMRFGNASRGTHSFALAAAESIESTRTLAATLFGCLKPERVAFTKNVTEALNIAVSSLHGHIVTTEAEHNSVLRPVFRHGTYSVAPIDTDGRVLTKKITGLCRPDTQAIVLGHASNLTGNVSPIQEIGAFCRERNIYLIVDAAQTAGLLPIDMTSMGIDAFCFTGHKALYGSQGTGGICLSERFTPDPLIVGGSGIHSFDTSQPRELPSLLEAGTENAHGIAALGAGIRYVLTHSPETLLAKANALANRFLEGLSSIPGITFLGDYTTQPRMPIVSFTISDTDSSEIAAYLAEDCDIAVRSGIHCAPLLHKHFKTERQGAVRFSFSHFNTEEEVDAALEALGDWA